MTSRRTRFGILRHAPTLWNDQKKIQGQQDSSLSARGLSMAEQWGKELSRSGWDCMLCSDLGRVRQTTEQINLSLQLPVHHDNRLREQDWGEWSGMTLSEIKKQGKDLLQQEVQRGWDFRPPGGESRREVLARSMAALADAHVANPGTRLLVVCHEGVIKCLVYHLLMRRFLPDEPKIIEGFYLHLLLMEERLSLEALNAFELAGTPTGSEDE